MNANTTHAARHKKKGKTFRATERSITKKKKNQRKKKKESTTTTISKHCERSKRTELSDQVHKYLEKMVSVFLIPIKAR